MRPRIAFFFFIYPPAIFALGPLEVVLEVDV